MMAVEAFVGEAFETNSQIVFVRTRWKWLKMGMERRVIVQCPFNGHMIHPHFGSLAAEWLF